MSPFGRRYNRLLRNEENEIAFWESIKNTNEQKKKSSGFSVGPSSDSEIETGQETKEARKTKDLDSEPKASNRKNADIDHDNSSKVSATSKDKSAGKSHRTKHYDKHHQKDRHTRKYAV